MDPARPWTTVTRREEPSQNQPGPTKKETQARLNQNPLMPYRRAKTVNWRIPELIILDNFRRRGSTYISRPFYNVMIHSERALSQLHGEEREHLMPENQTRALETVSQNFLRGSRL